MKSIFILCFVLYNSFLFSQRKHSHYVGEEKRSIKAFSDDDIKSLKESEGMGLAKAAELNHYPGPKHVLEIADVLKITDEQKISIQSIYKTMNENAVRVGNEIITKDTNGRCNCYKVEIWEHENNSAICLLNSTPTTHNPALEQVSAIQTEVKSETPQPAQPPINTAPQPVKQETPPLHYPKSYNTYKDPFAGTSWGNNAKRTK